MKLTTKNVKLVLKTMKQKPCKEGMKALDKLLKQKKSMEFVFNKMNDMRRIEYEISYARWLCHQLQESLARSKGFDSRHLTGTTFENFKILFEKL